MKTYEVLKPLPGLTLGGHVDEADLITYGGVERMLELQQIREVATKAAGMPAESVATRKGSKS